MRRKPSAILLTGIIAVIVVTGSLPVAGSAIGNQPLSSSITHAGNEPTETAEPASNRTVIIRLEELSQKENGSTSQSSVSARQATAQSLQAPLLTAAKASDHITIEQTFWLTNAVLASVDTDHRSLSSLTEIEHVTAVHDNIAVQNNYTTIDTETPTNTATTDAAGSEESGGYTHGVARVNADRVWNTSGNHGGGVKVAVLDTGVNPTHPDIDISQENWAEFSSYGLQLESGPYDDGGHGTHVSGTVVGGNSSGTAIGVAPNATLMHGKVLDGDGVGTFARAVAGMQWAVENDADVISMSFGSTEQAAYFIEPVMNAEQAGTVVIASVGNSGVTTSDSPANVYESVAVGGIDKAGSVPAFSGGETITSELHWAEAPSHWPASYTVPSVVAPSTEIFSAASSGGYSRYTGTSMAVPHVTGAVALLRSDTDSDLSPAHVRERLATTAEIPPGESESIDTRYGHGVVNAAALVASPNTQVGSSAHPPRDLNHDGLYEDVNGDGATTVADVKTLFKERDSPVVEEHSSNFDFESGNGTVSVGDVQALYSENMSQDQ